MLMASAPTAPVTGCAASSTAWMLPPHTVLAPGRRVIRRLGSGGAHEAFLVNDGGHGPAVAKLPRPHLAGDPHCLLGLKNEARGLERLACPTVPLPLDIVLSGAHPHLLLEYVPGPTLDRALAADGPLSPHAVASIGSSLASTLDRIAAAGWVHLDVKPSNIVLSARPYLLDFELARPATEAALMTRPTGTWAFMPPEQRGAGHPGVPAIGPPADVFALALSLGEALVGRLPADAPARSSVGFSGPVGRLLDEALAPAPADRPTAAELAAGLAEHAEPPMLAAAA
jgi:eukaryotic-like serine/threonine-protein kinase